MGDDIRAAFWTGAVSTRCKNQPKSWWKIRTVMAVADHRSYPEPEGGSGPQGNWETVDRRWVNLWPDHCLARNMSKDYDSLLKGAGKFLRNRVVPALYVLKVENPRPRAIPWNARDHPLCVGRKNVFWWGYSGLVLLSSTCYKKGREGILCEIIPPNKQPTKQHKIQKHKKPFSVWVGITQILC